MPRGIGNLSKAVRVIWPVGNKAAISRIKLAEEHGYQLNICGSCQRELYKYDGPASPCVARPQTPLQITMHVASKGEQGMVNQVSDCIYIMYEWGMQAC